MVREFEPNTVFDKEKKNSASFSFLNLSFSFLSSLFSNCLLKFPILSIIICKYSVFD